MLCVSVSCNIELSMQTSWKYFTRAILRGLPVCKSYKYIVSGSKGKTAKI